MTSKTTQKLEAFLGKINVIAVRSTQPFFSIYQANQLRGGA